MILIETCPNCGHDLVDTVICTMPPIPRKECSNCGWSWEGKPEKIIRVPFSQSEETEICGTTYLPCIHCNPGACEHRIE